MKCAWTRTRRGVQDNPTSPAPSLAGTFCARADWSEADTATNPLAPRLSVWLAGRSVPGAWPLGACRGTTGKPASSKPIARCPVDWAGLLDSFAE
jgi:hypothetical protein